LPSLSVIIPNFNDSQVLPDALQSIIGQSKPASEIIIVDDGSIDGSREVISAFATRHPEVVPVFSDRNAGTVEALNRGLSLAHGDFVFTMAADHVLRPHMFERCLDLLSRHPDVGLCVTDFAFFGRDGSESFPKRTHLSECAQYVPPREIEVRLARSGYIVPAYGGIFRTRALRDAGGFPSDLRWHSDWFAALVVGFRYGCCAIPEPLVDVRLDPRSYSASASDWAQQRRVLRALLELLDAPAYADVRGSFLRSGALAYFGAGGLRAAWSLPRWRSRIRELPLRAILRRTIRTALVRIAPRSLREAFWRVRYWADGGVRALSETRRLSNVRRA